jgi:hypothetical protein
MDKTSFNQTQSKFWGETSNEAQKDFIHKKYTNTSFGSFDKSNAAKKSVNPVRAATQLAKTTRAKKTIEAKSPHSTNNEEPNPFANRQRINMMFKGETPKLKDPDIKDKISKYPPPPNIEKLVAKLTKITEIKKPKISTNPLIIALNAIAKIKK